MEQSRENVVPQKELEKKHYNGWAIFFAILVVAGCGGFLIHMAMAILHWLLPLLTLMVISFVYLYVQFRNRFPAKKNLSPGQEPEKKPINGTGFSFAMLTVGLCGYYLYYTAMAILYWVLPILLLVAVAILYLYVQWRKRFPKKSELQGSNKEVVR